MLPEDNQGETPEAFETPVVFTQLHHHWRARGNEVCCTICPNPHGFSLPPGTHLTGVEDDGTPIIATVW
jgi:hypothetical protein